MFSTLLAIFGSAGGGVISGILGTAFKDYMTARENEKKRIHDRAMRKIDQEDMRLDAELRLAQTEKEIDGKTAIANIEGEAAKDIADADLQGKSYEHDKATYSEGWQDSLKGAWGGIVGTLMALVDFFRGMMRPGIAIYLLVVETLLAKALLDVVKAADLLTGDVALELLRIIILSVVFLTATAVTWWYGSRPNRSR